MKNGFEGFEDSPVSAATIGAGIGLYFGPLGVLAGALIGGIVDVFIGAKAKAEARKKLKRAFIASLLQRYDAQIFYSALERMASGIEYLVNLGLRPGTVEFDAYLKKLLYGEIGYKGNCEIELKGPAPKGQLRPTIAKIDKKGVLTAYSPNIDINLGQKWIEACSELHKAALKEWAEEQKENILIRRDIEAEQAASQRVILTKILVNAGIILLMLGYTSRTKRKLKTLRASDEK